MTAETERELFRRLGGIEQRVAELSASVVGKVEDHENVLYGNNGTPGIKADVYQLKEARGVQVWHFRTIWTAVIGLLVVGAFGQMESCHERTVRQQQEAKQ